MKMPGKAWLEFGIEPEGERNRLRVTAHYHTTSIGGRTYWAQHQHSCVLRQ